MFYLIGTLLLLGIATIIILRRYLLMTLRWPSSLGFYKMNSLVRKFLTLQGWKVRRYESTDFSLVAHHKAGEFAIRICPSEIVLSPPSIKDFCSVREWAPKISLVIVTANPPSLATRMRGQDESVFVFHYKELDRVAMLDPATELAVRELNARLIDLERPNRGLSIN